MAFEYQGFATLGVNLNRQKYGPLDISNVFSTPADLRYYLSKGAETEGVSEYWYKSADEKVVPYPYEGQVIATVFEGVVNVYALALDSEGNFVTQNVGDTSAAEEAIAELESYIGTIPEGSDAKTIIEYINKKTEGIATDAALSELQQAVEEAQADATDAKTKIDTFMKLEDGQTLDAALDSLKELQDYITTEAEAADKMLLDIAANKTAIEEAQKDITANTTAIDSVNTEISALKEASSTHLVANDLADYAKTADVLESIQTAKEEAIGASLIKSVDTDLSVDADGKLSITSIDSSKVIGLPQALSEKADKSIVEGLATTVEQNREAINSNKTSIDNINTRINDITAQGGEPNTINEIKVNGVALAITEKVVDIPGATEEKFGVVKLGSEFQTNETTNVLEVKEINVNKLVQTDGDTLVLDGGLASNISI